MSIKIETPEALRHSGIYSIGANKWVKSKKNKKIGIGLSINPEEVWGLKNISGSITNLSKKPDSFELQLRAYSKTESGRIKSTLLFTRFIKLDASQNRNFEFKSKTGFLGKILGPFEEDQELFLTTNSEFAKIFVSANFERINPPPFWQNSNSIAQTPEISSQSMKRFQRDIYFIADPDAEEFEKDEFAPKTHHKLRDKDDENGLEKKWHMCPKCTDLVHHGDQSGGLEIIKGGKSKIEIKDFEKIDSNLDDGDLEIATKMETTIFVGKSERVTGKELKELDLGAKNRPGAITCNSCGEVSSNEKNPPICKRDCPEMFVNDVMASSWHKGPNGKYHYCEVCVQAVMEANGLE